MSVLFSFLIIAVASIALGADSVAAGATRQETVVARSFSEVQAYGDYLYWLDRGTKGIYRIKKPVLNSTPPNVPSQTATPEKIWGGLPLKSPVGIGLDHAGVIYVVDDEVPAVFSLTPGDQISMVYSGAPLSKPTAIAAASGRVYIIDAGTDQLYNLDLARKQVTAEYKFSGVLPDRLLAQGTELLAYHRQSRVLLHFGLDKAERTTNDPAELEWRELGRPDQTTLGQGKRINLAKALGDVADLSFSNGIAYFLDRESSRLLLLPLDGSKVSSVPWSLVAVNPVALAASEDALYFVEEEPFRIRKQMSLQPVTLSFVGEWTSTRMVDFFGYLHSKSLLPSKATQVASPTTLKDLVADQNLMPTGYVEAFQVLFCELNPSLCSVDQKKPPPAGAPIPEGYPVSLAANQSVVLPDLQLTSFVTRQNLKLPLDRSIYKPEFFAHIFDQPLSAVAAELGPKGLSSEQLGELLRSYNPDYLGADLLGEKNGSFSIPILTVKMTAVVPRNDLLYQKSFINGLAEKQNIIGSSPMFQLKREGITSRRRGSSSGPPLSSKATDQCLPVDPALRSAAMDLISYCEPKIPNPFPAIGIIDYDFNERHPAFSNGDGTSALEIFKSTEDPVERTAIEEANNSGRITYNEEIDHGTHIAAIMVARPQQGTMVGLLPAAKLFGVRVPNLAEALRTWEFLDVFNVSLGDAGATGGARLETDELERVFVTERLKLFVLSAGNDNKIVQKDSIAALGYLDNVLVVGATDVPDVNPETKQRPPRQVLSRPGGRGSNRHPYKVGLMAPGENIKSALHNGQYGIGGGTSKAAPFVSATAGALMAIEPNWSPWQIKFRLVATADLWTGTPLSDAVFAGELNFARALSDTNTVVIEHQIKGICRGQIEVESLSRALELRGSAEPDPIPWSKILRIKRDQRKGTEYTIIYHNEHFVDEHPDRRNHYLRRLLRVTSAHLKKNYTFNFTPIEGSNCAGGGISIVDLIDFINRGPVVGF